MERVHTKEELEAEAARLAASLQPREGDATVIALMGDLGSGKTTFAQAFAKALGVEANVTSPTFVIAKRYPLKDQAFGSLLHIDAYRLEGPDDLEKLGFAEMLADPANLIVIEWADKVGALLPEDTTRISLAFLDEKTRTILYE